MLAASGIFQEQLHPTMIMWRDIFFNNKDNMIKSIDKFIKNLNLMKKNIKLEKDKELKKFNKL